ncbi:BatD family protein [Pontiella agarivorans]|uniref:BatD family protein n=1 Tax=Pontiella agarivorans TaxID=3038953 RepID=A0ABU5MV72_9BACT|nr:BatD family protein [Pontiella agarivorans]MDZ8118037.1 BatD family protein [Pontiella agarivorans]
MKKLILLTGLIVAGSASASTNFYAQATASETNVFLGQVFNLDVLVKAEKKPDAPAFQSPEFHTTMLVNGQDTSGENTWLYRYALRPKQEGELIVPSLHFGSVYSKPIQIKASKPAASDRMKLEQNVSAASVYVGEPLLLTTQWDSTYPFGAIKAVDFHFPILNDPRFQILEIYDPGKENQANTTGLPVHGTRVLATRRSYQVDGTQHQSLEFSKILIPKKSGRIAVAPATLLCAAEAEDKTSAKRARRTAFQYPAYFDNTFFDRNATGDQWTRIYTESKPIEIDVKPLPQAGRPDLFNGMVGEFDIEVAAEPTSVRVGEPITLTITVTASNYLENIFFEPLRYQPNLVNRFEIPADRSLPERKGKSKVYTQTIRPLSLSNTEIPPIQLAYFSPTQQKYIIRESAPIPLQVSAAEEIGVFGGSFYQNRLRSVEEGIRQNYEDPDMLKSRQLPLFGWAHPALVLLILLLPPAVFGGVSLASLFGEKKHHIHRTAKAARAFNVFRRNVAHIKTHSMKAEIYGDLDRCLRAYFGDRLHLVPGALSYRDAEARLLDVGADDKTLEELKHLFALCEAYRFTRDYNETGNAAKIVREATRIVRTVERKLK